MQHIHYTSPTLSHITIHNFHQKKKLRSFQHNSTQNSCTKIHNEGILNLTQCMTFDIFLTLWSSGL